MKSVNSMKGITERIDDLSEELSMLLAYDMEELSGIIKDVGFSCTLCGRCCTREFNDHVFLLDEDVERAKCIKPDSIVPAPYFDLCDNEGDFYVCGYALRSKENGDCIFLSDRRCSIYDERFSICRIYPYMLHREYGDDGRLDWRQISGLNEHGEYYSDIPNEECRKAARETIVYESAFLKKEIDFLHDVYRLFEESGRRPVRKVYDRRMREFESGAPVTVYVHYMGRFERNVITKTDYYIPDF